MSCKLLSTGNGQVLRNLRLEYGAHQSESRVTTRLPDGGNRLSEDGATPYQSSKMAVSSHSTEVLCSKTCWLSRTENVKD